ncbi:MAG: S41 family peptidase [Chloroflexota bacterium]
MSKRINIIALVLLLLVSLNLASVVGCDLIPNPAVPSGQAPGVVNEAWSLIFQDYVTKDKLDAEKLAQGAVTGMVDALNDPYSAYLPPDTYRLTESDLQGKFNGIGAVVTIRDNQPTVVMPFPDSPAEKAGIQTGDVILAIDDNSTEGTSLEETVLRIRGPKGTSVKLLILHEGEIQPQEIEVIRAEITVHSVLFEMRGDIAYIRLLTFSENTDIELISVLGNVTQAKATGIVLDLRRNLGGLVDSVTDVASHFLHEGVVAYLVDNQEKEEVYSVRPAQVTTDLPIVVLTDNFTASASELLAGALQDYDRAIVAGKLTYGKGSANTLYPLSDGSGLYLTTARWYTPDRRLIEGKGIEPDYPLTLEGDDLVQWAIDYLNGK